MPSAATPFPHLDALQSLLERAAGLPAAAPTDRVGSALFPHPFVTAGTLMWSWEHAHGVIHEWARWTREVPHDVTSAVRIVRLPRRPGVSAELRGRSLVAVEVAIPREPWVADGRLAALRRLEPEIDTVTVVDPGTVHPLHTGCSVPSPALGRHMGLESLPGAALDAFVAIAGPASGANLLTAALQSFGPAYGVCAAGLPLDEEDAATLELRLGLLLGRLAPFAAGRPAVEDVMAALERARPLIRRAEG